MRFISIFTFPVSFVQSRTALRDGVFGRVYVRVITTICLNASGPAKEHKVKRSREFWSFLGLLLLLEKNFLGFAGKGVDWMLFL